jgi:hypothetical protein
MGRLPTLASARHFSLSVQFVTSSFRCVVWQGPWRRRALSADNSDSHSEEAPAKGPTWPVMEAFGSQVLPRDLSLGPDGSLRMVPVPELASLRKRPDGPATHFHVAGPAPKTAACLPVRGRQLEIQFTCTVHIDDAEGSAQMTVGGAPAAASVSVLASPDGRERTLIGCNATHLLLDQMQSTLTPDLTPEELKDVKFFWNMAAVSNHTILHAPLPSGPNHTIHAVR